MQEAWGNSACVMRFFKVDGFSSFDVIGTVVKGFDQGGGVFLCFLCKNICLMLIEIL